MKITQAYKDEGDTFDTDTDSIICTAVRQHGRVHMCFQGEKGIVPFARIRLRHGQSDNAFDTAQFLGEEIARRWNEAIQVCERVIGSDGKGTPVCSGRKITHGYRHKYCLDCGKPVREIVENVCSEATA